MSENMHIVLARALCGLALLAAAPGLRAETGAPPQEALAQRIGAFVDALNEQGVTVDPDEAYTAATQALISAVDPHARVQSDEAATRLQRHRDGRVYGPGFDVALTNGTCVVHSVQPGSPADAAGLQPGTALVTVNDADTAELSLHRLRQLLTSTEPAPLVIACRDDTGATTTLTLERVESRLPAIADARILPLDLGYLQVNRLHADAAKDVPALLADWGDQALYGVLLDLRGADGEALEAVRAIAGWFASENDFLFAYRGTGGDAFPDQLADRPERLDMPLMVLIDADTGGAAEVLAAVFKDSVRGAMLFGQSTRGDFLLRRNLELPSGEQLYIATRQLVTAGDTVYTGRTGVRPHVTTVDAKPAGAAPEGAAPAGGAPDEETDRMRLQQLIRHDATLQRAVDVMLGLRALDIHPL
jgi:carboxyl-terminal processing protease